MSNYLNNLNEEQKLATTNINGPMLVLAGAGSGKTRVLTYRIAHLMDQGVDPFRILALTFTNKAAKEMQLRIAKIINGSAGSGYLWMGTFHSIFARILRIESEKIGFPSNFTIYDTDDSRNLIRSIVKELKIDDKIYKPSLVQNRISAAKNNLISAADYLQNTAIQNSDMSSKKPRIGEIYRIYERRCFKASAMDFDDLLLQTFFLLNNHSDMMYKYQDKFQYILVDEFQDTNYVQYAILKILSAKHENICVVGDDAQSIYAFRGANIENILNFQKDFTDTKVFKLEQNYRSTKTIVSAANSVIEKNKNQFEKNIWTDNKPGELIPIFRCQSDNEEGKKISDTIYDLIQNQKIQYKDCAILYRTNAQSRALEEALRKKDLPYRIYGGLSFYKRKEIKDLIAYFRLTVNPNDEEALKRVINYPARGIGKTTIEKLIFASNNSSDASLFNIIENPLKYSVSLNSGTLNKITGFSSLIKGFNSSLNNESAFDLGMRIAKHTNLLQDLYNDKSPEGLSRYENIQELLNAMKDFCEQRIKEDENAGLADFMEGIALLTDTDEVEGNQRTKENDGNQIALMTIHAAKGLEFPYVFIAGMEENLFPSQLSLNSRIDLEEERRLFYVALTRSEKQVFLSYAQSRYKWGNLIICEPSRFLNEIDPQYITTNTSKNFRSNSAPRIHQKENPPKKSPQSNFKPINTAINTASNSERFSDAQDLIEGATVKHHRFGLGKIIEVQGSRDNRKAKIVFKDFGEKQILLKYARLKIIPQS